MNSIRIIYAISAATCTLLLVTACRNSEAPTDQTTQMIETELGPITKSSNPDSRFDPEVGRYESFLANGYAKNIEGDDRWVGMSELRMFNPSTLPTRIDITLYFDNKDPVQLDESKIDPLKNDFIMVIPGNLAQHFEKSNAWGMRIVSDVPIMVDHILVAGVAGPGDKSLMGNYTLKGGVSNQLAQPRAATEWYFGDGYELVYQHESTAPFPFNEFEWYHILNPGPEDTEVTLHCYYDNGEYDAFEFLVKSQRVRIVSNRGLVRTNHAYGMIVTSTKPIVVQAERFIRDFHEFQDWGAWIHNSRPGVPAPFTGGQVGPGRSAPPQSN